MRARTVYCLSLRSLRAAHSFRTFCTTVSNSTESKEDHPVKQVTAAGLIIGDEILTGKITDANSATLAKFLWNRGIKLCRIETVTDDIETISSTLARLKSEYDYIFTSGGIGPTHDDKTYEAIAKTYGKKRIYHEETLKKMKEAFDKKNVPLTEARKQMAYIPEGSTVLHTPELDWLPLCIVENQCYILPGVSDLFTKLLHLNSDNLPTSSTKFSRELIGVPMWEGDIADKLSTIAAEYKQLSIGSYPMSASQRENSKETGEECLVVVSIEGTDAEAVTKVKDIVTEEFKGRTLPTFPSRVPAVVLTAVTKEAEKKSSG